jgi:predicted acetyltransferase
MVDPVAVTQATIPQRALLDRLLQLYLHDFSEYAPLGSPHGEVDENGRFAYRWLDSYWQEADRVPLLIRANSRIAGFVLLNQWSALDQPVDRVVAEFFVLRKYRRARVGTRAAHLVFHRYPGRWEVPVADYNREALLFWRSVVRSAGAAEIAEHDGDGQRWSGTVLCFTSGLTA